MVKDEREKDKTIWDFLVVFLVHFYELRSHFGYLAIEIVCFFLSHAYFFDFTCVRIKRKVTYVFDDFTLKLRKDLMSYVQFSELQHQFF